MSAETRGTGLVSGGGSGRVCDDGRGHLGLGMGALDDAGVGSDNRGGDFRLSGAEVAEVGKHLRKLEALHEGLEQMINSVDGFGGG